MLVIHTSFGAQCDHFGWFGTCDFVFDCSSAASVSRATQVHPALIDHSSSEISHSANALGVIYKRFIWQKVFA